MVQLWSTEKATETYIDIVDYRAEKPRVYSVFVKKGLKRVQKSFSFSNTCIYQKKVVLLQLQKFKRRKNMLATPVRERGYVPMMGNYESDMYYTRKEFMDELASQLGQAYGLNDIREAK